MRVEAQAGVYITRQGEEKWRKGGGWDSNSKRTGGLWRWKGGKTFNWGKEGEGYHFPNSSFFRLVLGSQCMTLRRVVSAHATAGSAGYLQA